MIKPVIEKNVGHGSLAARTIMKQRGGIPTDVMENKSKDKTRRRNSHFFYKYVADAYCRISRLGASWRMTFNAGAANFVRL